jgi:hypothetical protein
MELYRPSFVNKMHKHNSKFGGPSVANFVTSESPKIQAFLARFEGWFSHIPREHQKELAGKLRSTDDRQFLGAYFEVVLHEFLLQRGYRVTIHPDIGQTSGRPDFLVSNDNSFYLEVATRFHGPEIAKKENEANQFLRMIDSIPSPYFVIVQFYTWLPDGFDSERAKHILATYLNSLSFEQPDEIIKYFYKEQGALIEYAIQKKPVTMELPTVANRGLPAMFSWGSDLIRSALFEKATRHRGIERLGLPFVIALCSSGDWMVNEKALDWALFGREQVTFFPGHPERGLELHRDLSGLFSPTPGDPSGGNTWVSAVVFCQESGITSEGGYRYLMKVCHNFWAAVPLPIEVFKGLPQLVKIGKTETEVHMDWIDDGDQVVLLQ